jgi:nucleoside-diphosphate-sugar epimerase
LLLTVGLGFRFQSRQLRVCDSGRRSSVSGREMRSSHGSVAGHTFDRLNGERLLSITSQSDNTGILGMKRILMTGAAGKIGSVLRKELRGFYPLIRLLDIAPLGAADDGEELYTADIRDAAALATAMVGIDCVVHLAGMSVEARWEQVLPLNIEGCYNVFEVARLGGVKRMVFASSNHAVGFHRRERFIDTNVVPRPDTRYGVSKVFGEALGRLYADKYGLSVACTAGHHPAVGEGGRHEQQQL